MATSYITHHLWQPTVTFCFVIGGEAETYGPVIGISLSLVM